ncbi:hypothetical protein [Prosthecobacter sp.]
MRDDLIEPAGEGGASGVFGELCLDAEHEAGEGHHALGERGDEVG